MGEVKSNRFVAAAVHALRIHRRCGDNYTDDGWPEVNAALAEYAKHKRMWKKFSYFARHQRKRR